MFRIVARRANCAALQQQHPSFASGGLRTLTKQASPETERHNVRTINRLMAEVRGRHPTGLKLRMPTRLSPQRSWVEETKALEHGSAGQKPLPLTESVQEKLLQPKRMHDSYVELYLPFSKNQQLVERYVSSSGGIRIGKVLEDLDTLAGNISYQHALGIDRLSDQPQDFAAPLYIVTASVDRLDLLHPLLATADYRLSGQVIYVGSSSMEVFVSIEQLDGDSTSVKTCLTGRFTMAARDVATGKSRKIAPLALESDGERDLFAMGQDHKDRKREYSAASLERVPPSQEEAALLHERFLQDSKALQNGKSHEEVVPISETFMASNLHMHPQQRNVHSKVFGGFLMRAAYELAWMTAASFVNGPVVFLALDALSFHEPVAIGAMLSLSSQVTYTTSGNNTDTAEHPQVAAVSVLAEVVNLETGERRRSNTFHFSFDVGRTPTVTGAVTPASSPAREARRVTPVSYKEAMEWVEGRRRVELGQQLRQLYAADQQ